MGGGDLNTKKSWHPNTMKNQERVWKAEQAAAEEKKKILELQRERELEHDRTQLNQMAQRNFGASGAGGDNKLHWMYDKPNKQAQHEDYLLGKALGKNDESEQHQNTIPAVNRRVIGSSMLSSTDDSQVDLARKMREDPLLLVKERERAARAALLNNPLQRKRIAELLRKEQDQKDSSTKKKLKKKEKDLDKLLASKLNALGTDKGINLANLLNSDDSSSDSSSDEQPKKKRKKVKQKKKKRKSKGDSDTSDKDDKRHRDKSHSKKTKSKEKSSRYNNDFDIPNRKELESIKKKQDSTKEILKRDKESRKRRSSENEKDDQAEKKRKTKHNENDTDSEIDDKKRDSNKSSKKVMNRSKESRKRHSSEIEKTDRADKKRKKKHNEIDTDSEIDQKKRDISKGSKQTGFEGRRNDHERRRAISPLPAVKWQEKDRKEKRKGLSSEERAARLAEMAAAGAQHEADRGRRVARQRAEDSAAEATHRTGPFKNEARALPDSLESRIHSNRHYIQRDKTHMDKHFARR